jgi:cell wall-associated NlpC family hydrolase
MKIKKIMILGLVAVMTVTPAINVNADAASEQAAISASIDEMETRKNDLLGEIDDLETQLVTTISGIDDINEKLTNLEADMQKTAEDLEVAEKDKAVQHEAMKMRIQYVYERGGDVGWAKVFLENGDINAWLNSNSYTNDLYKYDRDQLQAYADAVNKVAELQAQQRDQKAQLEKNKNSLSEGENRLQELLDQAKSEYTDYDAKIADAYAKAEEYRQIIAQQNESISQMVQLQSEEAAAVDTSSAEAQAAIDSAAQQLAAQTGADYNTARQAATQAFQQTGTIGNGSTANGAALLAYAQQFLGNKYVYGGNSLTDGIDCSGFVQQVYKQFGIDTSRTSWDIASDGREVSYNDAQVGDVFVYDGHVGIYAGNGQMINAADEAHGITYTNVDYDQIQTIRRYLSE